MNCTRVSLSNDGCARHRGDDSSTQSGACGDGIHSEYECRYVVMNDDENANKVQTEIGIRARGELGGQV